ncbi:hypothetical protein FB451DRAFT_1570491 [Mycena latifolia]|nr:hypothetical protein FB451DRAFT_1570491 [Mycena latifolia]
MSLLARRVEALKQLVCVRDMGSIESPVLMSARLQQLLDLDQWSRVESACSAESSRLYGPYAAVTQAPSGLDADPSAYRYLALPCFNNSLDFSLELDGAESTATVTYVLTDAPPDSSWPVLIFFNGLGGHRLIAAMIEGIAHAHSVQIVTLDKPGTDSSARGVALPLAACTRWMHTALLAVLAHTHIARFAALSHSNGLFYALYMLLHLSPALTATS